MKKVALVFVVAVLAPSLVLAWLALRSLRDQQFLIERQQSLLDQHVTDALAQRIADYLAQQQQAFGAQVERLAAKGDVQELTSHFDDELRRDWPLAEVGFCVTASGKIISPPPNARQAAQMFRLDNSSFLGNREPVEVYWSANSANSANGTGNGTSFSPWGYRRGGDVAANPSSASPSTADASYVAPEESQTPVQSKATRNYNVAVNSAVPVDATVNALPGGKTEFGGGNLQGLNRSVSEMSGTQPAGSPIAQQAYTLNEKTRATYSQNAQQNPNGLNYKAAESRKVNPQSRIYQNVDQGRAEASEDEAQNNLSKVVPAEAEFRQLIGDQTDGILARFLQNKLKLMCWHRLSSRPDLIFGAQLDLKRLIEELRGLLPADRPRDEDICLAILDDNAKPVALSRAAFKGNWKRPFVATEIGDVLPHWEAAAYLVNPAQLTHAAQAARITLGLLIMVLVMAIGAGSVLIVRSLNAELKLARQKTDFVSNVSHELKTPLTSIRMFSELLAEGRVADPVKQRSYMQIITAEAARLTRLINNVLDFSRLERGEKKYNFQQCDLAEIARTSAETLRPHLEEAGFRLVCELPGETVPVRGDADALSQVIVNLMSNAEKYSNGGREIGVELVQKRTPLPHAEIKVLDRGTGVPKGSEEKIFEQFYRAHDSLSSGIQGSGLGLTIARQIARAHGGDVVYERRDGGGSCFVVRLPVQVVGGAE